MKVYRFYQKDANLYFAELSLDIHTHPLDLLQFRNAFSYTRAQFNDVVDGKKKILFVSAAPHPDSKALREVVDKNSNYEFLLHIPGVSEQQASVLQPDQIDLVIFLQAPDLRGKTRGRGAVICRLVA